MAYEHIWINGDAGIYTQLTTTSATGLPAEMFVPVPASGLATGGGASTLDLQTGKAVALDHFYTGWRIKIVAGTSKGEERVVRAYTAANLRCTVDAWATTTDNTSRYVISPPVEGLQLQEIIMEATGQSVLWLLTGGTPTSSLGHLSAAGDRLHLRGGINTLRNFRVIDGSGAAAVHVTGIYG